MNGKEEINQSAHTSVSECDADRLDSIDFFIVTRVPVKTYRFKWILNQLSDISSGEELYSCLLSSCYKLKFIKYGKGFGLFHVIQTLHKDNQQTISTKTDVKNIHASFSFVHNDNQQTDNLKTVFGVSPTTASSFDFLIPQKTAKKNESCTDSHVIEYHVSVADKHGKERIKWTTSFSNKKEYYKIGEYRNDSWETFFSDVLVLHCCMRVIKVPETEKQFLDTEYSFKNHCWQKLSQDLKSMYQNSIGADFTLKVGAEEFRVNSSILAARSPVFKQMLHHDKELNTVTITDVPLPAMKKLVEFLYTGVVSDASKDISVQETYDLYYAADKYEVMDLQKMSGTLLMAKASVENACQILLWADRHSDQNLKSQILNFISLNYETVVDSEAWRHLTDEKTKLANEALDFCVKKFKSGVDK